jgi:hypothetical protein
MSKTHPHDEHRTEALGEPLAAAAPALLPPSFRLALAILFACGLGIAASPWWAPRLDAWFDARAVHTSAPAMPQTFHCSREERMADTFQVHILDRKTMLVLHCRDAGKAGA